MHAIGLAVTVLGLQMALKSENFLVCHTKFSNWYRYRGMVTIRGKG